MTENSRPWAGTVTGDAGPYSDADWQQLYQHIIGLGGLRANVGPFLGSGAQPYEGLWVQAQNPTTASIDVLSGSALVQGIAYLNDDTESFVVAANASGNPRIDTVVVQADYAQQTARLVLKQGTPAASPTPPSLTQTPGIMWEIPIADIAVANGFTTISQGNITPRQEWVNAPPGVYLDNVLNNSGGVLVTGEVVIADTSADRGATTTTTGNDIRLMGVWVGRTANSEYGRVLTSGIGYVRTTGAVTRGDILTTSTTAGAATTHSGPIARIGRALETTSGAGLVLALIDVTIQMGDISCRVNNSGNTTINAGNTGTLAFNQEDYDTTGMHDNAIQNSRITFQIAGKYVVNLVYNLTVAVAGVTIEIRNQAGTMIARQTNPGITLGCTVTLQKSFAVGDWVTVFINNAGGSNATIDGANTYFSAQKVG